MFQAGKDIHFLRQLLFFAFRHFEIMNFLSHEDLVLDDGRDNYHVVAFSNDFTD
jgi:hypothetical protein